MTIRIMALLYHLVSGLCITEYANDSWGCPPLSYGHLPPKGGELAPSPREASPRGQGEG